MLSKSEIETNKVKFIEILKAALINRPGVRLENLIQALSSSDFFTAPASCKYHANYEGGLCAHSLNVYNNLMNILEMENDTTIDRESATIVALLHDISKMNYYEPYYQNKKIYSENGSKYDELGKYDWKSVLAYKHKDSDKQLIYGNHEMNAEFIAHCYIPLTVEESVAILHHMGGKSQDSAQDNLSEIYKKYPLALYLHLADMIATFVDENK